MAYDSVAALVEAGISQDDAQALRRVSMVLQRWHELECGDSDDHKSFSLVRGRKSNAWNEKTKKRETMFDYDDSGSPFLEVHMHRGEAKTQYWPKPDRERGAKKRLTNILARYPGFQAYIQTDPRGASLYIFRPGAVSAGDDLSSCYTRGIAVFK